MNLCSHNHEEVCYEDRRTCPLCFEIKRVAGLQDQLAESERLSENLKQEIVSLEEQIAELTAEPVVTAIKEANEAA